MKPTGKAYLISTIHWDNSFKYILLSEDLSMSSLWKDSFEELNRNMLTYPQNTSESTLEELLAKHNHLTLCAEVTLPFHLDNHPELLI